MLRDARFCDLYITFPTLVYQNDVNICQIYLEGTEQTKK